MNNTSEKYELELFSINDGKTYSLDHLREKYPEWFKGKDEQEEEENLDKSLEEVQKKNRFYKSRTGKRYPYTVSDFLPDRFDGINKLIKIVIKRKYMINVDGDFFDQWDAMVLKNMLDNLSERQKELLREESFRTILMTAYGFFSKYGFITD